MKEAAFLKMALAITTTMMLFQIATKPVSGKELHPIVLVPGSGGNQLEARLNSDYNPSSFFCRKYWHDSRSRDNRKNDGWYRIWFDPSVLVAPFTKCFSERMMLVYDPVSDDYHNAPGVETRAPHFGSVESLLYLAAGPLKHISAYMAPLVESLEEIGYVDGENLYGAPYDFRYGIAADGHPCRVGTQYLQDLKKLIERAVASNSGRPAVIVAHSLGGLLTLHLLLRSDPAWRQNFVKHVVALSTPWSGTVQMMLTFASGYTLGVPLVNPLLVRDQQRSTETNLWLMPMPMPATFGRSKPLVITPNATYTAGDILRFLNDIGCTQGVRRYVKRILPLVEKLEAPHVPVTCLVGSGVPTAGTLVYGEGGFDEQPEMVYGDGDGTVNMESLVAPEIEWGLDRNQTVKVIKFPGVSHTGILEDKSAIERVLSVVSDINSGVVDLDFAAI